MIQCSVALSVHKVFPPLCLGKWYKVKLLCKKGTPEDKLVDKSDPDGLSLIGQSSQSLAEKSSHPGTPQRKGRATFLDGMGICPPLLLRQIHPDVCFWTNAFFLTSR